MKGSKILTSIKYDKKTYKNRLIPKLSKRRLQRFINNTLESVVERLQKEADFEVTVEYVKDIFKYYGLKCPKKTPVIKQDLSVLGF